MTNATSYVTIAFEARHKSFLTALAIKEAMPIAPMNI
jgi:hypothetical protein